jgi:polysaccharide deacetylase 2 family uncharacterized protein YibQ
MDRRDFLLNGSSFLLGGLLGLTTAQKAFASEKPLGRYSSKASMALIIDDIGHSASKARQFLELNVPITFSILPRLAYSYPLAIEIHRCGHEIMLHQPMEPHNAVLDPGPGSLYVGYEGPEITRILERNMASVPFAAGVNNHMGSKFTECAKEMNEVLRVVAKNSLFYIDSLTSSRSTACLAARRLNVTAAPRDIFLDNTLSELRILSRLRRLERCAAVHGGGVGIGHPFPETARAIRRFLEEDRDPRVSLVHVSSFLKP